MEQFFRKLIPSIFAITTSIFVIYNAFKPLDSLAAHSTFFLLIFAILFLREPPKKPKILILDIGLAFLSILSFGYVALFWEEITFRVGIVTLTDIVLGFITIILILEAVRRYVGISLVILVVIFLLYGFFGQYLPRELGGHGGFTVGRIITYIYLSLNGIFGTVTYALFKYVFLFVMFGEVLKRTGALDFIMDFALAIFGRIRGGPAMVAVVSSAMIGMVTGSPVANVMITGTATIPLMKRIGFKPEMAGAVEAAASTGGQIMPPIMGAAAFLMMEFLSVDYVEIMKVALIPAILYYIGVFSSVAIYSKHANISKISFEEIPNLWNVLIASKSLIFFGGLGVLISLLIMRYSPVFAAIRSIETLLLLSIFFKTMTFYKEKRSYIIENLKRGARNGVSILEETTNDFIMIGAAGAAVGIIAGMVMLTGLAGRLSNLIIGLAGQESIFLTLVLVMIACLILGMGLPTVVCYVVMVLVVVPTLIKLGILPIAAHMFVFFYGIISFVTPPVCLASYAAATIAKSDFWETGIKGFFITIPGFILPFAFVLHPKYPLLMKGSFFEILIATLTAGIGIIVIAIALFSSSKSSADMVKKTCYFFAGIMLILPEYWEAFIGFMLLITGILIPQISKALLKMVNLKR